MTAVHERDKQSYCENGYNKLLTFYKDSDDKKKKMKKIPDDDQEQRGA